MRAAGSNEPGRRRPWAGLARRGRLAGVSGLAALAVLVSGCTGGSTGSSSSPATTGSGATGSGASGPGTTGSGGQATGTASATTGPSPVPYASLAASPAAPIGSASATTRGLSQAATLEVLAVRAGKDVTTLEFRLSTATPVTNVYPGMLHDGFGAPDVGGVQLVAKQANQRLSPLYAGRQACLCSWMPLDLGPQGSYLRATYPALPASVTTVDVAAPGFAPITVPVSRG